MTKKRLFTPPSNVQSSAKNEYDSKDDLYAIEKYLCRYNEDIVSKLSIYCKKNQNILDFGAGIGTLCQIWKKKEDVNIECVEIDPEFRKILTERGFHTYENLDLCQKNFDMIYTSNVIEHIDDDIGILKKIHSKLKTRGLVAIYVPAFMCLYSELDIAYGHYRRYEKRELMEKVKQSNFNILECYYDDGLGFFASLFIKIIGYKPGSNEAYKSFKIYGKYIYPISKLVDKLGIKYIF